MKIKCLLILIFPIVGFCQDFERIDVPVNKSIEVYENYKVLSSYSYKENIFSIVITELATEGFGLKMLVKDKSGDLIFESDTQGESYTMDLKFFESKKYKNQTIILAHISNEYSWGNHVFLNKNGSIIYLGLLDLATYVHSYEPWDISEFIQIFHKGKSKLNFLFETEEVVLNPGGEKQQVVEASRVSYLWDKNELVLSLK